MKIKLITITILLSILNGCATTTIETKVQKSYSLNLENKTIVGDALLIDQNGYVQKNKRWVGILNSPDGWKIEETYSNDYIRKELIYSGKTGSTIEISYREFRGGLAAPAFYQNIKYDLNESKVIRFQKYTISISEATNESIKYKILKDY